MNLALGQSQEDMLHVHCAVVVGTVFNKAEVHRVLKSKKVKFWLKSLMLLFFKLLRKEWHQRGQQSEEIISKSVDFSIWGNHATALFALLHYFSIFRALCAMVVENEVFIQIDTDFYSQNMFYISRI